MFPPGHNFTERVRKIVADAHSAATRLGHAEVGPIHLAAALIKEGEGVAATALQFHGFNLGNLERELTKLIPAGAAPLTARPAMNAEAKLILVQAGAESKETNHAYVGTEHLLLALLRDATTPVAQTLGRGGFGHDQARARILWILTADPHDPAPFTQPAV